MELRTALGSHGLQRAVLRAPPSIRAFSDRPEKLGWVGGPSDLELLGLKETRLLVGTETRHQMQPELGIKKESLAASIPYKGSRAQVLGSGRP